MSRPSQPGSRVSELLTPRKKLLAFVVAVLALALSLAVYAAPRSPAQTTEQPQTQPWNAGNQPADKKLTSNLTLTNDCKHAHTFSITVDAPFLSLMGVTRVTVPGKKSVSLPAVFDTSGLAVGYHTGLVTILCLDCGEVPPCVQDKKTLAPQVTIIPSPASPPPAGGETNPSNGTTPTPPQNPPTPATNDCQEGTDNCNKLIPQILDAITALKEARAEYAAAVQAYDFWDYWSYEDCADADAWHEYIVGLSMQALMAGSGGPTAEELASARQADEDCKDSEAKFDEADTALIAAGKALRLAQADLDSLTDEFRKCLLEEMKKCPFKLKLGWDYDWRHSGMDWTPPPPPVTPPQPPAGPPPHGPLAQPPETPKTVEKPPCPTADDCEKLRLIWNEKQAEAFALQANADKARADADQKQKDADAKAKAAADAKAAIPTINEGSGWMESGGIRLTSHDLQLASAASQQAFADYQAGRITGDQLQQIWAQSGDAAAIAKLRDAENAAIEAAKKKAEDLAAEAASANAIALGARANAATAQAEADQAKAEAEAAHQNYLDCLKKREECAGTTESGGGGGTPPGGGGRPPGGGTTTGGGTTPPGGGNPPHTQSNPCPPFPEDCGALEARWKELKNLADIAQALADRAKEQQDFNNKMADGLDQQAASTQASGDSDTAHAQQWRQMAGNMAAMAETALQRRDASPAGSANWTWWDNMYQDDLKEAAQRNKWADELEASERKDDALAAKLKAQAAQLRNLTNDAQAKADEAKAEADAASKAWQDCLARKKAYDEECKKKAAETPKTVSPPTPTPQPPKPENPNPPPAKPPDATGTVGGSTIFVLGQHGMPDQIVVGEPRVDHPGLTFGPHYNFAGKGSFTFVCNKPGTYKVIFDTDDGRRHVVTIVCPEPEPH